MEYFQNTLAALKDFNETMIMAKDAYASAKKEILATFKSPMPTIGKWHLFDI